MKRSVAAIVLAWLAFALPAWAQPRAWLDRDRIAYGETVTLTVEIPSATAAPPDYRPLQRDFALSAQTSRRGMERSNGRLQAWTQYSVSLEPRRAGTLVIPALAVAGARTLPLTVRVEADAPPPAVRAGAPVFIESAADDDDPYVQQAVVWVVRLYSATPILSGQLDQQAPDGAALQRIGEDAQYTRDIGGRRYQVFERRYLLLPERSGPLLMPGARFEGRAAPSLFEDLFGQPGDVLRANAQPRRLHVQPIPDGAPQPWLPLRDLQLRYRAAPQQAHVGEAATLEVELTADGAGASQLPALELPAIGAQVFPEPAQTDERQQQGQPRTVVTRRFALVPARTGTVHVPAMRIGWWDVRAGRARSAALPELVLPVVAAAGPAPATAAAPPLTPAPAAPGDAPAVARGWVVATLVFAALWLVTLLWALQRRGRAAAVPIAPVRVSARPNPAQLRQALDSGDLADVEEVLKALAPRPASDGDAVLAQLADPAQRDALEAMRRARWADGDGVQARRLLRAAFADGPRWHAAPAAEPPLLPPLYPPR